MIRYVPYLDWGNPDKTGYDVSFLRETILELIYKQYPATFYPA